MVLAGLVHLYYHYRNEYIYLLTDPRFCAKDFLVHLYYLRAAPGKIAGISTFVLLPRHLLASYNISLHYSWCAVYLIYRYYLLVLLMG